MTRREIVHYCIGEMNFQYKMTLREDITADERQYCNGAIKALYDLLTAMSVQVEETSKGYMAFDFFSKEAL